MPPACWQVGHVTHVLLALLFCFPAFHIIGRNPCAHTNFLVVFCIFFYKINFFFFKANQLTTLDHHRRLSFQASAAIDSSAVDQSTNAPVISRPGHGRCRCPSRHRPCRYGRCRSRDGRWRCRCRHRRCCCRCRCRQGRWRRPARPMGSFNSSAIINIIILWIFIYIYIYVYVCFWCLNDSFEGNEWLIGK